MSFDEISYLLKESNKKNYELARLDCYFNLIAQGTDIKKPEDIVRFTWEKKTTKKGKKLNAEQLKEKEKRAEKYLKHDKSHKIILK